MMKQLPARGLVCSEYQKLLEESAAARDAWRKLQAKISWARLVSKESADELLRLQARYAKTYALLQKHVNNCGRCQPMLKTA